jgi:hypothetical protein
MHDVQLYDNNITNNGICILVAAYDAYTLRNTCQGGSVVYGGDVVNIVTYAYSVTAYNTINQWNAACCAVGHLHFGLNAQECLMSKQVVLLRIIILQVTS